MVMMNSAILREIETAFVKGCQEAGLSSQECDCDLECNPPVFTIITSGTTFVMPHSWKWLAENQYIHVQEQPSKQ